MNGQKVVKVFCHEDKAIEEFNELNENLYHSANRANTFSLVAMPVNGQLANLSYVVCAIVGGMLALSGATGLTLGKLASFLTFNRSFNQPINQISMQFNSIVMALAGAQRIFALLDEKPEVDTGDITLVNAKREEGDELLETTSAPAHGPGRCRRRMASIALSNSKAISNSRMSISAMTRRRLSCMISPFTAARARRLPLSVRPALARQRLPTSSTVSMTSRKVPLSTTALTLPESKKMTCAVHWDRAAGYPPVYRYRHG